MSCFSNSRRFIYFHKYHFMEMGAISWFTISFHSPCRRLSFSKFNRLKFHLPDQPPDAHSNFNVFTSELIFDWLLKVIHNFPIHLWIKIPIIHKRKIIYINHWIKFELTFSTDYDKVIHRQNNIVNKFNNFYPLNHIINNGEVHYGNQYKAIN